MRVNSFQWVMPQRRVLTVLVANFLQTLKQMEEEETLAIQLYINFHCIMLALFFEMFSLQFSADFKILQAHKSRRFFMPRHFSSLFHTVIWALLSKWYEFSTFYFYYAFIALESTLVRNNQITQMFYSEQYSVPENTS